VDVELVNREMPPVLRGCNDLEPFVADGARLWGRSVLGVRCAPTGASAFVPVHVHVFAPALVAARDLPAGYVLSAEDVRLQEIEVSAIASPVATDLAAVVGRQVTRSIPTGSALRTDAVRARNAINAGDAVRLVYSGTGFSVSAEGKALAAAPDGQPVRVQTEAGKLLTGLARPNRVVEVAQP
jgi:flagella basal body P-ring formation protein FlgA